MAEAITVRLRCGDPPGVWGSGNGGLYRVLDDRLEREVALKVLVEGRLGDEGARKRFIKEAKALSLVASRSSLGTGPVLHFVRMSHTITVRLTPELATWLKDASVKTGVAQGEIIREQLERARASSDVRSFMRLAGAMRGPRNLSSRKGFSPR